MAEDRCVLIRHFSYGIGLSEAGPYRESLLRRDKLREPDPATVERGGAVPRASASRTLLPSPQFRINQQAKHACGKEEARPGDPGRASAMN